MTEYKTDLLDLRRGKSTDVKCAYCGLPMHIPNSRIKKSKACFCSMSCRAKGVRPVGLLAFNKAKSNIYMQTRKAIKCKLCGKEFFSCKARIERGDSKFCSKACYQTWQIGVPKSDVFKEFCKTRVGEKSPTWKGGLTKHHYKIRISKEYITWKLAVLKRDSFTCQECGKSNVTLDTHHIKSFSKHPDLRLDVSNGITLCRKCHVKKHPWLEVK